MKIFNKEIKPIYIILTVMAIIIGIIATLILLKMNDIKNDHYKTKKVENAKEVQIEIPEGAYLSEIANILYKNNIIKYPDKFIEFATEEGNSNKYKYGVFYLNVNMSYEELSKNLQQVGGAINSVKVTIPEGYELRQIINILVENGIGTEDGFKNTILNTKFDYWFLNNLTISDVYLEGYLFPATYTISKDASEEAVLKQMLDKFNSIFTEEMKNKATELNMSVHEIITLASIVEREAANDSERDIVASVFYNRLNSKTYPYLESCATVQYILKERKAVLTNEDTKIDSPYNTYKNLGLPAGPIASPGLESIKATLYPASTDYLFFVLGNDGKHVFSKSYSQHLAAISKIRGN